MPRPVLVLRHAQKSKRTRFSPATLLGAAVLAATAVTTVGAAPEDPVSLGPVKNVAMTYEQLDNRAEHHPDYARRLGHRMAENHGWDTRRQWRCLRRLWNLESSWHVHADNPSSSAYGIPQAMPGSKMSTSGDHWRRSAQTQIRWGIRYVKSRYNYPCHAMRHKNRSGWY